MAVTGFSPSFRALASPTTHSHTKTVLPLRPYISIGGSRNLQFCSLVAADTGSGVSATAADEAAVSSNGSVATAVADDEPAGKNGFHDARWKGGTWDLTQFTKDGQTNWDAVIDAEVKRRKWMEDNPQSSSNEDPVTFDTSIVPWWAWMKRFHLPEAELLNGRAAMIGFFMAYIVDGLTGVGLVDQMENFFCKTLLLVTVGGVLLIRKNQDIETIKKLVEETTFYDKQWQASWQDETQSSVAEKQND